MALYQRLLGTDPSNPKIPVHGFEATMYLWAIGSLTNQQAQDMIAALSGAPLTAGEVTEVNTLKATVTTGTTAANKADRALDIHRIACVLQLADSGNLTETQVKALLGVA